MEYFRLASPIGTTVDANDGKLSDVFRPVIGVTRETPMLVSPFATTAKIEWKKAGDIMDVEPKLRQALADLPPDATFNERQTVYNSHSRGVLSYLA
jgi:hypothetical protein